jgi:predicted dehydrogenase
MTTTRIAMVGAGSVARRHVGVLNTLENVQIVSVTDPVEAAASELARECNALAFTDTDQALDSNDLDAAYICVPPFAHGAPEKAALARGLAMFVEKPVATDLATAEELATLVATTGAVSMSSRRRRSCWRRRRRCLPVATGWTSGHRSRGGGAQTSPVARSSNS